MEYSSHTCHSGSSPNNTKLRPFRLLHDSHTQQRPLAVRLSIRAYCPWRKNPKPSTTVPTNSAHAKRLLFCSYNPRPFSLHVVILLPTLVIRLSRHAAPLPGHYSLVCSPLYSRHGTIRPYRLAFNRRMLKPSTL